MWFPDGLHYFLGDPGYVVYKKDGYPGCGEF
ncbi:hypothetical protein NIASO_01915 [Niabella soli DSM 19437]|uniref:Uncharacterized protein n=1 Tax=Niabella soli DSM 19437 TaxID=929713 RepID=W0F229_9BACT|nr:hypothetical protein NIASO_01915 [Niabella soli DSM 19437]